MTISMTTEDGAHRARVLQGTRVELGEVTLGVLGAAVGDLPEGGVGLRARLQVFAPEGVETVIAEVDDEIDLGPHGLLHLVRIDPAAPGSEGPEMPADDRAVVYLELRPAD